MFLVQERGRDVSTEEEEEEGDEEEIQEEDEKRRSVGGDGKKKAKVLRRLKWRETDGRDGNNLAAGGPEPRPLPSSRVYL